MVNEKLPLCDFEPAVIKDLFTEEEHKELADCLSEDLYLFSLDKVYRRYFSSDLEVPQLRDALEKLVPQARRIFNSETLLPTYAMFAHYVGPDARLPRHKDDNACTYTIDCCLYQTVPWEIWIEGKPYSLNPNEAVAYSGTDQLHWREKFPGKHGDYVAMVFFHFAEPEHWFFTHGRDHIMTIRNMIKTGNVV